MRDNDYGCIFSIVIAIYNCEPFLRETLDSIISQKGFSRFENGTPTGEQLSAEEMYEVITVDDGSTDLSGKICDEYAQKFPNFKAIHKQNGGVASARNEGVKYARGKYINFLDGDDKFSDNLLKEVYAFFEKNYEKTDIVTVPLRFFDAVEGEHWQNYKFKERAEVVDLFKEYDSPLMFVNASFFKGEHKDKTKFSDKLVCGEDIRYICEILADKMTMGLVPYCRYHYRRRSAGEESLVQTSKKKLGWYFDYFEHLTEWGIDFCKRRWGYVPYYYQNILFCDLQWRFNNEYEGTARVLLGKEKYEEYKRRLWSVLGHFDDEIILAQRSLWSEHKYFILLKKYGAFPKRLLYPDDVRLKFGNTEFCWLSSCFTEFEFIEVESGTLTLEGKTVIFGYPSGTKYELFFEDDHGKDRRRLPCQITDRDASSYKLDERLYLGLGFKFELPLKDVKEMHLCLVLFADGEKIVKKRIRFGKFSPIGKEFSTSFYSSEGYTVTNDGYFLKIFRTDKKDEKALQKAFIKELLSLKKPEAKRAALALRVYGILKRLKRKPLVIISDRVNKAGDNGEALFRFLCGKRVDGFRFVFAIESASADYARLKKIGSVVNSTGRLYKLLYLLADCIASSHADERTTNPFDDRFVYYRSILSRKKYVFLQHGITKDDASNWLGRFSKNITGLVCAGKPEADAFEEPGYQYSSENIWCTGFPRFDGLYENNKRLITVMPTWRMYLSVWDKAHAGVWKSANGFMFSKYFSFFNRLLNDTELISRANQLGYTICFMPHPNVLGSLHLFKHHPNVVFFEGGKEYRDIFAESSLILTDYSSAVFDFAYLKKPILYTQFDKEEFFSGNHAYKKGYFDYERDGFGEVAYDYDSTVKLLIEYMSNGCRLKEKYRERIENFYLYFDRNNSRRVYEKISELLREQK